MAGEIESGRGISDVIETAKPPIFYKLKPSYERQLKFWSTEKIIKVISEINDADIRCKSKDSPQETILSQLMFMICSIVNKRS